MTNSIDLYLIRHPHAEVNRREDVILGADCERDSPRSSLGDRQLVVTIQALQDLSLNPHTCLVYSTDLKRADDAALDIMKKLNIRGKPISDPRLQDNKNGSWVNQSKALYKQYAWAMDQYTGLFFPLFRPPGTDMNPHDVCIIYDDTGTVNTHLYPNTGTTSLADVFVAANRVLLDLIRTEPPIESIIAIGHYRAIGTMIAGMGDQILLKSVELAIRALEEGKSMNYIRGKWGGALRVVGNSLNIEVGHATITTFQLYPQRNRIVYVPNVFQLPQELRLY